MTAKWTTKDVYAKFILSELMQRANKQGYSDESAVIESFRLAEIAMRLRDGVKRPRIKKIYGVGEVAP